MGCIRLASCDVALAEQESKDIFVMVTSARLRIIARSDVVNTYRLWLRLIRKDSLRLNETHISTEFEIASRLFANRLVQDATRRAILRSVHSVRCARRCRSRTG
jgi:hypothetical protein